MLILGGDSIAKRALSQLGVSNDLVIVVDRSTNIIRIARLVLKRRLSPLLAVKMFFCELKRPNSEVSIEGFSVIKSNDDLLHLIEINAPERIVLFRAGLVISSSVISSGIPLLNIHCAKIPEYGGLGSISRAMKDGAIEQAATLHRVTTTIDRGEVFDIETYQLDLGKSYCYNEDIAYNTGIKLLMRTLDFQSVNT